MRLTEEIILLLLNEESGYLEQVAGWNLSCVLAGAVLADLDLESRIDTAQEMLSLDDPSPMGDDLLDPVLATIAADPEPRTVSYWVEKIAGTSDDILYHSLERLSKNGVLYYTNGGFWSLSRDAAKADNGMSNGESRSIVRQRIVETILGDEIPYPRDAIIIGLADACDAFRFLLQPRDYEASRERIELLGMLDRISRSVAAAVAETSVSRSIAIATKPIPNVSLLKMLRKDSLWQGNTSRLLADLYRDYGPVFVIKAPFSKKRVFVIAGNDANIWVNRNGRMHLRSKETMEGMETVLGASRSLPGMDGAEHFRMRKAFQMASSRSRLNDRLGDLFEEIRLALDSWNVGDVLVAKDASRTLMSGQVSRLLFSMDFSEYVDDIHKYKNRMLITYAQKILPKFFMRTPRMQAIRRRIDHVYSMIRNSHTPAQRENQPRDLIDDLLSLHASDPQYFPDTDTRFMMIIPFVAAMYMGTAVAFGLYLMVSHPDVFQRVRKEAEALFANGDPDPEDITPEAIDTAHRLILETLRIYPSVPLQLRTVMNSCIVEGYELPLDARVVLASTAVHYMEENYPDPQKFDIDRYLPGREEHKKHGAYGAFGFGTHTCLGPRVAEYQMTLNLLMIAYYFELEVLPSSYPVKINPFPTCTPRKSLKLRIKSKRPIFSSDRAADDRAESDQRAVALTS